MLQTAQDYINLAFRNCGQMRPGYTIQTEQYAEALTVWGTLFDSWAAERTMGFSVPQFQYAVSGPGSLQGGNGYTIGPIFTFSATTVDISPILVVLNTIGLVPGLPISGPGIPANTVILSVSPNTAVVMSQNATASAPISVTVTPNFIGPRPDAIVRANLVMTNVGPQPVYIPIRMISVEAWAALAVRQIPAINVTNIAYYDPQWPLGVFNVFPPLNGNSIELFTWPMLGTPPSLAAAYSAPAGYQMAVVFSLADLLWPLCTKAMMVNKRSQQWLAGQAYEACEKIRRVNRVIPTLRPDAPGNRGTTDGFMDSDVRWVGEPY